MNSNSRTRKGAAVLLKPQNGEMFRRFDNQRCYWCGVAATSREHVPPLSIFPAWKRKDLITVPACFTHNQRFSACDEKFRFHLQGCASSPDALEIFESKTIRSLGRPESKRLIKQLLKGARVVSVPWGRTLDLQVDPVEHDLYFEKITRGLHYHILRRPVIGRVTVSPSFAATDVKYKAVFDGLLRHLDHPKAVDGKTSHPEIFSFRSYGFIEKRREAFLILMIFYESIPVIGVCTSSRIPRRGDVRGKNIKR